jgi:glutaminase
MAKEKATRVAEVREVVEEVVEQMSIIEKFGDVADHVEGMKDMEIDRFGIAVVTAAGDVVTGGEAEHQFPIQSISKVFALTMALEAFADDVWKRVGREPSGDPFNSIVDLERHKGIPRNPFINAGALVVCDIVLGRTKEHGGHKDVRAFLEHHVGEKKLGRLAEIVAEDGKTAGFLNRSLANMAKAHKNLHHEVDQVMKPYVEQCAIELSCRQLALAGRYLMKDRPDPDAEVSHERARMAKRINSLMLTCGQYDGSGEFAFRVGLPAKSGVGGGILAIAPRVASIAVWSPGLDDNGNSLLGTLALEKLTEKLGWSIFG